MMKLKQIKTPKFMRIWEKMTPYIFRQYGYHNISKYNENNEKCIIVCDMVVMKPFTPIVTISLQPNFLTQNIF